MVDPRRFPPEELLRMLIDTTVQNRPLKDVQTCLVGGANPNGSLKQGLRPLHYGAYHNRADVLMLLIRYGAEVNKGDDIGHTALHMAAKHGYLTCAQVLLDHGAVVNFCDQPNRTLGDDTKVLALLTVHPLNLAIENNYPDMAELLLKNGADPNQQYFVGHEINSVPLENTECLEVLLRHGADPNSYSRSGLTQLMKACKQKETKAMRILLNYGADVDQVCHPKTDQKRALHYAVMTGSVEITRILLDAGADTRQPPQFKFPPLEFAITQDKVHICRLLLQYGANPNEVNENMCSMLQLACCTVELHNQAAMIDMLLEAGADPLYAPTEFSYITPCLTALVEYLACNDEYDITIPHMLLKYGAEVNLTKATGRYKIKDRCGVISQLRKLTRHDDLLNMLIETSGRRHREQARVEGTMPPLIRAVVLEACALPVTLKHQSRICIRRLLSTPKPRHIAQLPIPAYIKDYLLFMAR